MKAPSKETFTYILKCDRELLKEEQTVWHLKIITAADSAASLRRYARAFSTSGNRQELHESNYRNAYRSEFLDVVKQADNYQYGYKYPELQEKGYIDKIDDPDMIVKIWDELQEQAVRELIEAAKGEALLEETDRKK